MKQPGRFTWTLALIVCTLVLPFIFLKCLLEEILSGIHSGWLSWKVDREAYWQMVRHYLSLWKKK